MHKRPDPCPASVKSQWRSEILRFSERSCQLVLGSAADRASQYESECFFTICNYEQVLRDILAIERTKWDLKSTPTRNLFQKAASCVMDHRPTSRSAPAVQRDATTCDPSKHWGCWVAMRNCSGLKPCASSMTRLPKALSPCASGRATPRGPGSPRWHRWAARPCRRRRRAESAARAYLARPPWRSPAR